MSAFNGKWTLASGENVEAFYDAIHTPSNLKAKMKALATGVKDYPDLYLEEMYVDKEAGIIRRTVYIRGESKRQGEAVIGKESDGLSLDGRPTKITVNLVSDTKIVRQEKAADYESVVTVEVDGDIMTVTQVCGGVKAVERFKRH